jgi:mannose-6-phosphate isomerase-like protein (cupin superfamily)
MPGRVRTEVHLQSADTAGAFCLLVDHPPAGWSLPPHLHRGSAETIHVVEGEFEMTVAGERRLLTPGQTLHVPAGAVHEGANAGAGTGRRILVFSPGGMERFFLEAGARSPRAEVDQAAVLASAARHGWEFTGA